jgi:hypothetical protein
MYWQTDDRILNRPRKIQGGEDLVKAKISLTEKRSLAGAPLIILEQCPIAQKKLQLYEKFRTPPETVGGETRQRILHVADGQPNFSFFKLSPAGARHVFPVSVFGYAQVASPTHFKYWGSAQPIFADKHDITMIWIVPERRV